MNEIERMARAIKPLLSDIGLPYDAATKLSIKDYMLTQVAQAAYEASSAKLVPGLVEALEIIAKYANNANDDVENSKVPFSHIVSIRLTVNRVLSEYREWQEGK